MEIFFTSDLHFGHKNILNHEPKRWKLIETTQLEAIEKVMFNDGLTNEEIYNMPDDIWEEYKKKTNNEYIKIHDEKLIENWNKTVGKDDIIFILGDFSWYKGEKTNEILKQLNGKKTLIIGNHDSNFLTDKKFDKSLFEEICYYKELKYNKQYYILFHYPIAEHNGKTNGTIHLYGHIHTMNPELEKSLLPLAYNVGVDRNNYKPVSINNFII